MIKSRMSTPVPWLLPDSAYPVLQVCQKGENVLGTFVVLFTSRTVGVVVHADADSKWGIGHYHDNWVPSAFIPFHGFIKLENDL